MITSLQVEVSGERLRKWKLWKTSNQDNTRQSLLLQKETKRSRNGGNKKCPKALPGFSEGRLPGRRKAEEGRGEEDEEEENRERQMRSEVTKEVVASVMKKNDAAGGDVMKNTRNNPSKRN